ncbi:MAG TPA: WYL domain-containing protein, partial [Acidimicrobiia bacterium]
MSPRALAGPEIQRILALVPWIVAHPASPKPEIAARFGITVEQLDDDLALVLMIGVPPYSPGDYLDVEDEDGNVTIRLAEYFRRPLRLTPAEGLALLAAGRALLAVPGSDPDGPLATALAKLEDALELPGLVVDVGEPGQLAATRDAVAHHRRVEIAYWSAGRDELTTRRIDPEVVFFATGEWYVGAYCHRARDERMFRVDRIRSV